MKTQIFTEKEIALAAALLRGGELVAFPTETVYGLGACVFQPESIKKIYQVKKRPQKNPLIAHIAQFDQWKMLAKAPPDTFFVLAEAFFPGPLTLIVNKNKRIDCKISAGLETIAIRAPEHPLARKLIQEVNQPLVAPSANISGRPSSTAVHHVLNDFDGKIAGVIDGGDCFHGLESTVIDLVSFEKPTLMRYGALEKEAIETALAQKIDIYTEGPKSSPGMRYRHYAPKTPVSIFSEKDEFENHLLKIKNPLILAYKAWDKGQYFLEGRSLYSYLRLADTKGYDEVVIFSGDCKEYALLQRLEKIGS